jgi:hypothetical protein
MNHIMTIIFFHGISFGTNDEWKEAWTSYPTDTRHESVCWPEQWLPEDLGDNVRILSLSYDANVLGAHDHVTEIGKNLIHSLVTRYDSNLLPIIPQSHVCLRESWFKTSIQGSHLHSKISQVFS